ncbi:GNAT family N-acetyltransferase [Sandarakinorhabdus sp. DWP1-3-1]|uniref:GNAT family N-acetyltransferase n=1 Tax=Sandarakinorhabdus sp. DWP1-3-1 TaxID=2804627 RepID=UPI003CFB8402
MTAAPLSVRAATPADLPALHALIERAYRSSDGTPGWTHEGHLFDGPRTNLAALELMIAERGQYILMHEADGMALACVLVAANGTRIGYLGLLCVDPFAQATGLGRRLIAAAEREAVARFAATRMEMTVIDARTDLIAWYQRRGYAPTGEVRPLPDSVGSARRSLNLVVLAKALPA